MPIGVYVPAILCFIFGSILTVRSSKSNKISLLLMGGFFDGLGIWWILKALGYAPGFQKVVLILSLAIGGLGLLADALNIEKKPKDD